MFGTWNLFLYIVLFCFLESRSDLLKGSFFTVIKICDKNLLSEEDHWFYISLCFKTFSVLVLVYLVHWLGPCGLYVGVLVSFWENWFYCALYWLASSTDKVWEIFCQLLFETACWVDEVLEITNSWSFCHKDCYCTEQIPSKKCFLFQISLFSTTNILASFVKYFFMQLELYLVPKFYKCSPEKVSLNWLFFKPSCVFQTIDS